MLNVGQTIRYRKLGAGKVTDVVVREFNGEDRQFAVIEFPHRSMTVQVPIGDPAVSANLAPLESEEDLRYMLKHMEVQAVALPRTWDLREEEAEATIRSGGPQELVNLLGSYAVAAGAGVKVASSDKALVQTLLEMLAGDLFLAQERFDFLDCLEQVRGYYQQVISEVEERGASASHFGAVVTDRNAEPVLDTKTVLA